VNADLAILHTDALATHVAVPVNDPRFRAGARATIEETGFCLYLFIYPRVNRLIGRSLDRAAYERRGLVEVLFPVVANLVKAGPFRDLRAARRRVVKFT